MALKEKKKQDLSIFTDKKEPTSEVLQKVFDVYVNSRYPTLKEYLDKENYTYKEQDLNAFTRLIEEKLFSQVAYYAHLMYYSMELSDDWGEAGEQQVKTAFCRNLLKIDPKANLTLLDVLDFKTQVDKSLEELKIKGMSEEMAKSQLKSYKFNLFGKTFELYKNVEINRILQFCGSSRFFHGGQYGGTQEFILGEGNFFHKQGHNILLLDKELIRTPNNVMSIAAIIGHQNIYIRLESLKNIFAQKWLQMYHYSDKEKKISGNVYRDIAEAIKERVLVTYKVSSEQQLLDTEFTFIHDMAETILHHELACGVIQQHLMPFELGAIGEGTKLYGENIYTALLAFLADFAPPHNGILGPMHNMIQIAKKDRSRAERMYYMYLSDTWFFDTEDEHMYTYSDLMALILTKYINDDRSIHFDALEKDLQFREDRGTKDGLTLFERVFELYVSDAEEIKNIIEHATFTPAGHELPYKIIRQISIDEFMKTDGYVHEDSYEFLVPFWTNMIGYVKKISDSAEKLLLFMQNQERKNLMEVMILACGRTTAESYDFNHRKYITDRMVKLGFVKSEKNNK